MNKFDWSIYKGNLDWLSSRTVFLTKYGSHAYGTNTPESDLDIRGIAIPPAEYFHGFLKRFEQAESTDPDLVIYDIRKFFDLAANANPNVLDLLFTEESDHLFITEASRILIENRNLFLSKKVRHTYAGYAHAQLKRIQGHKAWLMNPRETKPNRGDFGLPESTVLGADILGAIDSVQKAEDAPVFSSEVMTLYHKERSYHNALKEYQQYQNWKKTRNPKRAAIEAEFGLDLKHASQLVRLCRMGKEILTTGQVIVKRPDARELLAIRHGSMTYEQIVSYAEGTDAEMEELEKTSPLPHSPDRNKLDRLCQEIVEAGL